MEISGHRTPSMFDRYNIVAEADPRDAQQKVGRRYASEKGGISLADKISLDALTPPGAMAL